MGNIGNVSAFNINGNQITVEDAAAREVVNEIISAIGANNSNIAERINDLHGRSFDYTLDITSNNESEIISIQDGIYKLHYVTVTGSGDNEVKTLNNSAILIQKENTQYLYKNGKILGRTKTNNSWGEWQLQETPHKLSSNYEMSSEENAELFLEGGDTYEEAFGKIEKAILDNEEIVANSLIELDSKINNINDTCLTNISWSDLKALRDDGNLVEGQLYRIIDYVTTTVQAETQSAGHQFDIIVVADANDKLNENAYATIHSGDTYFANSKLESWELKYCLDNDVDRFAWADEENGKGVIYWMKDEFFNECGYDFKNIMFARYMITAMEKVPSLVNTYNGFRRVITSGQGSLCPSDATINSSNKVYRYTFDLNGADYSLTPRQYGCHGNVIAPYKPIDNQTAKERQFLNNITFANTSTYAQCVGNKFESRCNSMAFGNDCYSNTFGNNCYYNTFGNSCYYNTFGINCQSNTFDNYCYYNTFGINCYSNTFDNYCYSNTFGNSCSYNTFGINCYSNTFGNNCYYNTFSTIANLIFGNSNQVLFGNDDIYQKKDGVFYPVSHPDLSTQPSILPQRFGNLDIKEIVSRVDDNGMLIDVPTTAHIIKCMAISDSFCMGVTIKKMLGGWKLSNNDMEKIYPIGGCDFIVCQYYELNGGGDYYYGGVGVDEKLYSLICYYITSQNNEEIKLFNKMAINYEKIDGKEVETANKAIIENAGTCKVEYLSKDANIIRNNAFSRCTALKEIVLEEQTLLGSKAFEGCTGLDTIYNYSDVPQTFMEDTFNDYTAEVHILEGLLETYKATNWNNFGENLIDDLVYGFIIKSGVLIDYVINNKSVIIPSTVTSISEKAFQNNKNINSINIPNNVTSINYNTFSGCSNLTKVELNNNTIVSKSYSGNKSLKNVFGEQVKEYIIGNSVTSIGEEAFYNCSGLTSVTIPNSVTSIGNEAFSGCSGLTSITIPNSVTSIGRYAFRGCYRLTSVTIPNSVTNIEYRAFSGCSGLTSVIIPNSVTSIGSGAFSSCSGLTSVTIPNSVTSIGSSAFSGCYGLTSVTIPNSVTSIGSGTFYGCSKLTSVTIPNSMTSIGDWAFRDCTGLTSVEIPNSVTSIGIGTFYDCYRLTSVTIPNSVTSIGESAFSNCTGLISITCEATTPPTLSNTDAISSNIQHIYVPVASVSTYKSATNWSAFASIIKAIS